MRLVVAFLEQVVVLVILEVPQQITMKLARDGVVVEVRQAQTKNLHFIPQAVLFKVVPVEAQVELLHRQILLLMVQRVAQ
jgi:hypothetical protein